MTDSMVVTNLRLPYADWLQVKAMAAESGVSVNDYIRSIVQAASNLRQLVADWVAPRQKAVSIWDLPQLARGRDKPMGLSPNDELIYGH
jgi:predicted DNA-binding ribbon-helix-helix protein